MLRSSLALYRHAYTGLPRSVWLLSVVLLVNRSGAMVIPFLTVYLKEELGFTIGEAGAIMGVFGAGSMLGSYIGGRLTDRIGFSQVQFWSLFVSGLLFLVLGRMTGFLGVALSTLALSIVAESFRPANSAAIAHYSTPENRTRSYSLNRLAINVGFSIGPAVGGVLASISYDWLFIVDGSFCILASLILRAVLPVKKTPPAVSVTPEMKMDSAFRDSTYMKFIGLVCCSAFCFLMLFSMVPLYYREVVHLDESVIGLLIASNGMLIVLVEMVLVYKLEQRQRPILYISTGALLMGISYFVLQLAPIFIMAALAMLFVTIAEMLMFPFFNTYWVSRSKEHNRGQYAAVFTMAFSLAHILAPTVGSQVVNYFGYRSLWYLVFAICIFTSIGFYRLQTKNT